MPPALCGGFNLVLAYVGRAQDSHCDILIGTGIFSKKIGWLKCAFHGVSLVLKYFYLVDWTDVLPVLRYYYLVDLLSVLNFGGIVRRINYHQTSLFGIIGGVGVVVVGNTITETRAIAASKL